LENNAPTSVSETHVSWIFLVGPRAYKLKKPAAFDFVDQRSREDRLRLCRREVELNRRLAPDVYLGVVNMTDETGRMCDHVVAMRRMPEQARLSTLVQGGAGGEAEVSAVVDRMAAFHQGLAPFSVDAGRTVASADELRRRWDANLAVLERFSPHLQGGRAVPRMAELAHRYLAGRAELFDARIADGRVRDGHGDLLADDVFCLPDGPRLLDCLEFDDALRAGDVLADMAFLAMDLERLERPDLANLLLGRYQEAVGDWWPESLADFYIAYRAAIRAKLAALRADEAAGAQRWRLARHLAGLAVSHLDDATVRLVLVGGLPGTGKSVLADGLGRELHCPVVHTDVVRKERFGLDPASRAAAPYGEGLYSPDVTAATYGAVLERARLKLETGRSVVIDGSWWSEEDRARARQVAADTHSEVVELRCTLPARMAAMRIRSRAVDGADPSDATEDVAAEMASRFQAWPEAATLSTAGPAKAVLDEALRSVRPRA
jgi:aminoglycoside phosphotransferase family enzyme/predicted kinase